MKPGDLVYIRPESTLGIVVEDTPENYTDGVVEVVDFSGRDGVFWKEDLELLNEAR